MSPFLASVIGQTTGVSASAAVLPVNIQDWYLLVWTGGIPCCLRGSQESPPTPQFKSINSSVRSFLYSPTLTSIHMENHSSDWMDLWWQVISQLFSMLSRLVMTFLPRSKNLSVSWLQSTSAVILEPPNIKFVTVSNVSPSIGHEVMASGAIILVFWMLSFKSTFSLSSFTYIKNLFSFSSLSAIRVVSYAYLRLLIFLAAVSIPVCASSIPAYHMIYSAYKLNKQDDNRQPWCTPFPIWNKSMVPCLVLTWPAYRFLRR